MEIVDSFSSHLWGLPYEQREEYLMGLARLKTEGMTYTRMGGFIGFPPNQISKQVKPYLEKYRAFLDANLDKLEASLKRNDPDYDYMIDPRTVTQQMCALLLGGDEVKQTLEQLMNLEKTK